MPTDASNYRYKLISWILSNTYNQYRTVDWNLSFDSCRQTKKDSEKKFEYEN